MSSRMKYAWQTIGSTIPINRFKILIITIYFHKQKIRKPQPDSNRYLQLAFSHLNYVTFLKTKQ